MSKTRKPDGELRRGWTTGACATAAARAAWHALAGYGFPDPVAIRLPRGETPSFALARTAEGAGWARASVIKDAGDDPDVTHGAEISATVRRGRPGAGVTFRAGPGVGTVTKAGLPIPPGEPAINPVPRQMMREAIDEVSQELEIEPDAEIEISVEGGEALAAKTWNPRLGIVGGLSILGTTGVVVPFSCAAWIHSIHRGIDVARAAGLTHVAGSTGNMSEQAVQARHRLQESALLDMGDFAGGLLKYLRAHPIPRLTIAGGFAKITKLAQGALDLHSSRSEVDLAFLAGIAAEAGGGEPLQASIQNANTAAEALELARQSGIDLADPVARRAVTIARETLHDAPVDVDIMIVDRNGTILTETGNG
jgi:cobalt-precorrin-5B (C1)-methyltransferase